MQPKFSCILQPELRSEPQWHSSPLIVLFSVICVRISRPHGHLMETRMHCQLHILLETKNRELVQFSPFACLNFSSPDCNTIFSNSYLTETSCFFALYTTGFWKYVCKYCKGHTEATRIWSCKITQLYFCWKDTWDMQMKNPVHSQGKQHIRNSDASNMTLETFSKCSSVLLFGPSIAYSHGVEPLFPHSCMMNGSIYIPFS